MSEKITVRLTPHQAAYLSDAGWKMARDSLWKPRQASVYRGGARAIRSALIDAGWVPDDRGWMKPAPSSEKEGPA